MSIQAKFKIMAVEGDHIFGPSEAEKMRLPFNEGWEGWAIFQGDEMIMYSSNFERISRICYALNNMEYQL